MSAPSKSRSRARRYFLPIALLVCLAFGYLAWRSARYPKNNYSKAQIEPFLIASELELFSLHPALMDYGDDPFAPDAPEPKKLVTPFGTFHDYPVLGSGKIESPDQVAVVQSAIRDLHSAGRHWRGAIAACFDPRHGVRLQTQQGTLDLLICYECSQAMIFRNETREGDIYFASSDSRPSPSPDSLNRLLRSRDIKLPEPPKP